MSELNKTYPNGVQALGGINLSISHGEMVGILGASGSGKTTLFRLLNGSLAATSGLVTVFGTLLKGLNYKELRRLRSRMAVVYQHHNIIPGLSVAQNVLMGKLGKVSFFEAAGMILKPKEIHLNEIYCLLERLGMAEKMYQRAIDLSGGQQQRVALARAIFSGAELILADEPIASVDSTTAGVILSLLQERNKEQETTVVLNLHQQDMALAYCSRVIVLDKGRLIYDGVPEGWIGEGGKEVAS